MLVCFRKQQFPLVLIEKYTSPMQPDFQFLHVPLPLINLYDEAVF